ncbi:PREDICTED: melanoma-associated antigen 10-like [Chinchilla lanigera]|uniref:melanoma-associated antigen 10-like n=1 Tax=Chinchilla lanigera TaxID=34839 RepID=UPI00038EFFFC|nr:PREDICTED: melanoma-associated antigen 10-like [Chinchilla lanigera]
MPHSLKDSRLTLEEDDLDLPDMGTEEISFSEEEEEDNSSTSSSFHFSFPSTSSPSSSSLSSLSVITGSEEEEEKEEVPAVNMMSVLQNLPQSPPSGCSSSASWSKLDEESRGQQDEDTESLVQDVLDKKVAELVRLFLLKYQNKELIAKEEMLNIVIKEYKGHFPIIFEKACEFTELIFGIVVAELGPNKHTYITYNTLDPTYRRMLSDDLTPPKTGLLLFVLGMIFMEGGYIPEEKIWEVLSALEVYAQKEHCIYGDPRILITNDWVQKKYLVYKQVPNSDPKCYEFQWGTRAHAEVSEGNILEFLAKLNGTTLSSFPAWCKDGLKNMGKPIL